MLPHLLIVKRGRPRTKFRTLGDTRRIVEQAYEDFKLMHPERFVDTTKEFDKVIADEK